MACRAVRHCKRNLLIPVDIWTEGQYNVCIVKHKEQAVSESTLKQYTRLLILAEAARAVSDIEEYRRLKNQALKLRRSPV